MKMLLFAVLVAHASAINAVEDDTNPLTLTLGSWVCDSTESYQQAVALQSNRDRNIWELQKELESSCVYMDDDNLEDMLPPFVKIIETDDQMVKVSFFVEFYKRVAMLHRKISHVKFIGWTEANKVKLLYN